MVLKLKRKYKSTIASCLEVYMNEEDPDMTERITDDNSYITFNPKSEAVPFTFAKYGNSWIELINTTRDTTAEGHTIILLHSRGS